VEKTRNRNRKGGERERERERERGLEKFSKALAKCRRSEFRGSL